MFLDVIVRSRIAESNAGTVKRSSTVDLKRFCGRTSPGFRLLSLIAVSLCFSFRYSLAQSMPHNQ